KCIHKTLPYLVILNFLFKINEIMKKIMPTMANDRTGIVISEPKLGMMIGIPTVAPIKIILINHSRKNSTHLLGFFTLKVEFLSHLKTNMINPDKISKSNMTTVIPLPIEKV